MMQLWLKMHFLSTKFGEDERGVTGIETALLVAGISIASLSTVFALGAELNNLFGDIAGFGRAHGELGFVPKTK